MVHVYIYHGHDVSEDMLLGIGGGVGFVYWHMKGADPFIGGRAKGRPGQGFEACVGERTGVQVAEYTTSSANKAEKTLLALLGDGEPVMLQVDMGFLPYFDFGGIEYHFGAHVVVACGCDAEARQVLIADRDPKLHAVSMDDLERARGSTFKPFPPKHRWYTFDFDRKRMPTPDEVRAAIVEQVTEMLDPPITNLGVKGIRKAARQMRKWPASMDVDVLRRVLFNTYIFIDAEGGTGGGLFRTMFARFLVEAAEITGQRRLAEVAGDFHRIADLWQEVAALCKQGWDTDDPAALIPQTTDPLMALVDMEAVAWKELGALVEV
jgi:hypothetical protein